MKSIIIRTFFFALVFAFLASASADQELTFKNLQMLFEVNETDGDGEIVLSVKSPEGLMLFQSVAPDGRVIISINSNDERRGINPIGLSQIRLETGEPSIDGVKKAYPEGVYKFMARTVGGERVYGEVNLSHRRLPAPDFSLKDEKGVDPDNAVVKWKPVKDAAAYEVEIENDDLKVSVTAELPGSATQFSIPKGFLLPGTEYEIGVMSINKEGNMSVAQSSFVTAKQR